MKKILITAALVSGVIGVYGQGTIAFGDHFNNAEISHVFSPQVATPSVQQTGFISSDFPVSGSTVYTGQLLGGFTTGSFVTNAGVPNYASGSPGYNNGPMFSAQLWAVFANGDNLAASALQPVTQYTSTFTTTTAQAKQGTFISVTPGTDQGITNAVSSATCALAVWYNANNTITSYTAALANGVPAGLSPTFNVDGLGNPNGSPPSSPANMTNMPTFSLTVTPTPEPSTIALGVIGMSAFLIRRRK